MVMMQHVRRWHYCSPRVHVIVRHVLVILACPPLVQSVRRLAVEVDPPLVLEQSCRRTANPRFLADETKWPELDPNSPSLVEHRSVELLENDSVSSDTVSVGFQ